MPKTGLKKSPSLAIELDNPQSSYLPEDVISGKVIRRAHTVSPNSWVRIKLFGRAKSKMTVSNGQNKSVYRGRFTLFIIDQKISEGPVHIPPDGDPGVWPFTFTIPKGPMPRLISTGNDQKYSNLSLKQDDIAKHTLPPSFYYAGESWGKKFHGYVEYYLEAEIRLSGSGSPAGSATLPVFIRPLSSPIPITDFDVKKRSFGGLIKTQRLVPGMETAELTFKQKTQKLFGSSKVPEFSYALQVDYPTIIQMGNPNTIPFKIRLVPNASRISEIIQGVPQRVTLTKLTMELKANTSIKCSGTFSPHEADKTVKHPIHLAFTIDKMGPVVLPSSADEEAIDFGAMLDLRLDASRPYAMGGRLAAFQNKLAPSFTTYNVRHSYRLKFEIMIFVAGESVTMTAEHPLSLLSPSEEQEREANNALTPEEKRKKYEEVLEVASFGLDTANNVLNIISAASG